MMEWAQDVLIGGLAIVILLQQRTIGIMLKTFGTHRRIMGLIISGLERMVNDDERRVEEFGKATDLIEKKTLNQELTMLIKVKEEDDATQPTDS